MSAKTNRNLVYNILSEKYGDQFARAAIGNLAVESGNTFDPKIKQDGGDAIGIAQWEPPRARKDHNNLMGFAKKRNLDPYDVETQAHFIVHEFENIGRFKNLVPKIQNAETQDEATRLFSEGYEMPSKPNMELRQARARNFMLESEPDSSPDTVAPVNDYLESSIPSAENFEQIPPSDSYIPEIDKDKFQKDFDSVYSDKFSKETIDKYHEPIDNTFENTYKVPEEVLGRIGNKGYRADVQPYTVDRSTEKEPPSFLSRLGYDIRNLPIAEVAGGIAQRVEGLFLDQGPSENFNPYNPDALRGIDPIYHANILDADNALDQERRRQRAIRMMMEDERFKDGSLTQKMLAGGIAMGVDAVTDPAAWIPIAGFVKYGRASANVLKNIARTAPGVALGSLAMNVEMEADNKSRSASEFILDSGIDAVAGEFLVAGAAGLGAAARGGSMYAVRRSLKSNFDGIYAKPVWKEGEGVVGYKAERTNNSTAGAAEVDKAQELLDSKISKTGLLRIPFLSDILAKTSRSPIMIALNHTYSTLSNFMERMGSFSIETVGQAKGKSKQASFEEIKNSIEAQSTLFTQNYKGLKSQFKGAQLGEQNVVQRTFEKLLDSDRSPVGKDFNREVSLAVVNNETSKHDEVNLASKRTSEILDSIKKRWQRAKGFPEQDWLPPNADGYLHINYHKSNMIDVGGRDRWAEVVPKILEEQDQRIAELRRPLNRINGKISEARGELNKGINIEQNKKLLDIYENEKKRLRDDFVKKLRDDMDNRILLEDGNLLNSEQAEQLKQFLEPLNKAQENFDGAKETLKELKNELKKVKKRFEKKVSTKDQKANEKLFEEHQKNVKELEGEIESQQSVIQKLEDELESEKIVLDNRVNSGEIGPEFYIKNPRTGEIKFHDPEKEPQLRAPYRSQQEREEAALDYYESIMGMSEDQLMQQVLRNLEGNIAESPLKKRSLMLPQNRMIENNFTSTDVPALVANYSRTMGREIALEESLAFSGVNKSGMAGVFENLSNERRRKIAEVDKIQDPKKRAKENKKVENKFKDAKKRINIMYDIAMGRNKGIPSHNRVIRDIRNLQAATQLNSTALTQLTDLSGIVLKNGLLDSLREGFLTFAKSLNGMIKNAEGIALREQAEEASLALEHELNGHANKMWSNNIEQDVSNTGRVSPALEKLSKFSGNFFLINQIENANQRLTASIIQNKIMRHMHSFLEGTLSDKDRRALLFYDIIPEKWAKTFVEQFNQSNGWKGKFGNYQSNWHIWTDTKAKLKMADAVRRGVHDTIIKAGLYDTPLITRNPFLNLLFTYKGWAYAGFNRHLVPALQRPDLDKAYGIFTGLVLGSLEDPLRKWSRGEEADILEDNWYIKSMANTSAFSFLSEAAVLADALTGEHAKEWLQNDRKRQQTLLGLTLGPTAGLTENWWRGVTMFASGDLNQSDWNRFVNGLPLVNVWWLRWFSQQARESLSASWPTTRNKARKSR